MPDLFLELFSEEIPSNLQKNARNNLLQNFKDFFEQEKIIHKSEGKVFSTPNRLIILFDRIDTEIHRKSEYIRGPNINAPEKALDGFVKSNKIEKKNIFEKQTEKGKFYFFKKPAKKIQTIDLLNKNIPDLLRKIYWKKSMKWGDFDLYWGRPLKSILAIFGNIKLNFKFHHLHSSNSTFLDKEFEEKTKVFSSYKLYESYFKKSGIIIDHNKRKKFIEKKLSKISKNKSLEIKINDKLLDEVTNIVESPKILNCKFDQKFLKIPKEILIITMQHHQKYFPTFDKKNNLTNNFLVVANTKDLKGFIKLGNERVVEARLNDAQFFWQKNKSKSLVKQVSELKKINYFKGLGTYFDKIQRMRKLSSLISDELLISKEKIEIASSICKVDLLSDLVGEFPELQGVMGGYFATAQGFDKDICLAISEHYLPTSLENRIPKKSYSIALSLTDKLDTLVGFFGIELKPSSSKDPYALRRSAIGLIRLLLENGKEFKIRDLINYSTLLYHEQKFEFDTKAIQKDLIEFLNDRLKNYMKEKGIKQDIIEAAISSYNIDQILKIYNKAVVLNKFISKEIGKDIISSYKRASNILSNELKDKSIELNNSTEPDLFKNKYEKNLYTKINEIRKYFTNVNKDENYENSLKILASTKKEIFEFFDNVIVNDENEFIKKNRLELLQMLCKAFDNYIDFSSIGSL
ncbi:MAG TPA: glycine--tRNA ligase subunit beta [Candidatus Pelagibacter sp.]|nr:glycine--tRNA ligase subunit beta [Candidatus Pelagibacter sp.]